MSEDLKNFEISASDEVFDTNETENNSPLKKKSKQPKTKEAIGSIPNGAIGIKKAQDEAKKTKAIKPSKTKSETVAIYSTKNVFWPEVGRVYSGYNIVDKEVSEKWLTRDHIRSATPEEVAREFGAI